MIVDGFSKCIRHYAAALAQCPAHVAPEVASKQKGLEYHPPAALQGIDSYKESGGRGRDRTYDQSIKSRMLYQLSYASSLPSTTCEEDAIEDCCTPCFGLSRSIDLVKITQPARPLCLPCGGYPTKSTFARVGIMPRSKPISRILRMASRPSSP